MGKKWRVATRGKRSENSFCDTSIRDWVSNKILYDEYNNKIEDRIVRLADSVGTLVEILHSKGVITSDEVKEIADRYSGADEFYEDKED